MKDSKFVFLHQNVQSYLPTSQFRNFIGLSTILSMSNVIEQIRIVVKVNRYG